MGSSIIERLEELEGDQLTASEIADVIGVSRNTVYTWHRKGVLPGGVKIGGTVRFDKAAVVAHIRDRQGAASA